MNLEFLATPQDGAAALLAMCGALYLAEQHSDDIELVLAEAINNIVFHAYDTTGGPVWATLEVNENGIECRLSDNGRPFEIGHADLSKQTFMQHGRGIPLMTHFSESLTLYRAKGRNTLIIKFKTTVLA